MNNIMNKFLLAGDKLMSEMHLRQSGVTYSVCGPLKRNKTKLKIQRNNRLQVYLQELTRQGLFLTKHKVCIIQRFTKKKGVEKSIM